MTDKTEAKKEATLDKVKRIAQAEHQDFRYITTGTIEGSKNATEYAIATDTGLFFYLFKNEKLQPLDHVLWENVKEIKVDYLAMRTNLTLNGQNYRLVNEGKKIFALAQEKSEAKVEKVDRKWHQKILGFRSGTHWKKITAVIAYLLIFGFIGSFFFGEEEAEVAAEDEPAASTEVASEETEASAEEKEAELKRIEEIAAAEEKKQAEKDAAAAEEKALAEEKEVEKDAAVLDSFNAIRTEMINQGSGVVDMDIAKDPSYYQIKIIVDESIWANSTESQKMSFVTSLSTVLENEIDETLFYDVYSNINEDIVATTGILGSWKIKR
ncbi:hypothetical protein [Planococcus halocryophilus]|uniref:Uncharacterized protein n=1 Tax=Planococcus halocryophilus TaxID=1215089 RepID=A0A1C7DPF8_9BACL|nr:hypothetical protein [Planococcus halocryophilus]ANU13500.1 hypothetical protein BBI08_06440 [Planococcus halocryophilus]